MTSAAAPALAAVVGAPGHVQPVPSSAASMTRRSCWYETPGEGSSKIQWCERLFSLPLTAERLILKQEVQTSQLAVVLALDEQAREWLRRHPEVSFQADALSDYYLVDREQFAELFIDSLQEVASSIADSPSVRSVESTLAAQPIGHLRLGRKPLELDQKLIERVLDELQQDALDLQRFVDTFNARLTESPRLRVVALFLIEKLVSNIQQTGDAKSFDDSNFTSARLGLAILAQCTCAIVQRAALERLIDVLNADPISEKSFNHLPDLIERLVALIDIAHSKNCDTSILRLMIQAYATSIMTLWLHTDTAHNASIIDQPMKDKIWERAEIFGKQLKPTVSLPSRPRSSGSDTTDQSVLFWIDFAIQAAQRLTTNVSAREIRMARFIHLFQGIRQIASMVAFVGSKALGGPDIGEAPSGKKLSEAVEHLKQAFYHMENRESWFETTLAFHYCALLVRYFPEYLSDLDAMAYRYKAEQTNVVLFFGIISSLEQLLLHTHEPDVAERCYKILMTNLFINDPIIQQRTIQALLRIKSQGNACLSTTARCLLVLIWETMTPLRPLINKDEIEHDLKNTFESLSTTEKQLAIHCMALFIRRVINIQSESGMSQETLVGLVTRAQTDDPDGDGTSRSLDVLRALRQILNNPLTRDVDGNGALHACVIRCNRRLIGTLLDAFHDMIQPNDVNLEGKTALMLCVDPALVPMFLEGIEPLATVCNPNLRDFSGNTFLHYLILNCTACDLRYILTKIRWCTPIDPNIRNADGLTPIMLCLSGSPPSPTMIEKAKVLIELSASQDESQIKPVDLHLPDRYGITGLNRVITTGDPSLLEVVPANVLEGAPASNTSAMMAAKADRPEMLRYILARLNQHNFTKAEIFCIFRCALLHYSEGSTGDEMMKVVIQAQKTNSFFARGCSEALPKLSWIIEGDVVSFKCENDPLPIEILRQASLGNEHGPLASRLFGLNDLMNATLPSSKEPVSVLRERLQREPDLLKDENVLGRGALQMALLGGRKEVLSHILSYERQNFNRLDYKGDGPTHYAAATLSAEAFERLLNAGSSALQQNNLGLIPIILTLASLPVEMLPDPVSYQQSPYKHLCTASTDDSDDPYRPYHEAFCHILDCMMRRHYIELESYRSPYGWSFAHWAAVYGHRLQAYEIIRKLPQLLFARHRAGGRTPLEHAMFHQRFEVARAFLDGWIASANGLGISNPLEALHRNYSSLGLPLSTILTELGAFDLLHELRDQSIGARHGLPTPSSAPATLIAHLGVRTTHLPMRLIPPQSAAGALVKVSNTSHLQRSVPLPEVVVIAIKKGLLNVLELFLDGELGINQLLIGTDVNGYTATMLAAKYRQIACLRFLLQLASDHALLKEVLEAKNYFGQTAVHILCSTSRSQAINELIKRSPATLREAIIRLDEELKECLEIFFNAQDNHACVMHSQDESGQNVVHMMCYFNHAALLTHLIKLIEKAYRASPRMASERSALAIKLEDLLGGHNDDRRPPVFMAVAAASEKCLDILNEARRQYEIDIRLSAKDAFGIGCLAVAAQEGHLRLCARLLQLGLDAGTVDDQGNTAAHQAATNHHLPVVEYLCSVCDQAVIKARNQSGLTLLHAALMAPNIGRRLQRRRFICNANTFPLSAVASAMESKAPPAPLSLRSTLHIPLGTSAVIDLYQQMMQTVSYSPPAAAAQTVLLDTAATAASKVSVQLVEPDSLNDTETSILTRLMDLLCDCGLSLQDADNAGLTSWHYMCRQGPYADLLAHALSYAATRKQVPNFAKIRTESGLTVFHVCAQFGQVRQLEILRPHASGVIDLKSYGATFTLTTGQSIGPELGLTPAAIAILERQWAILDWLIRAKCRLTQSIRDHERRGPKRSNMLHLLANTDEYPLPEVAFETFKKVSREHPGLLMESDEDGRLPLEKAVQRGHLSLLPLIYPRMAKGHELSQASLKRAQAIALANLDTASEAARPHPVDHATLERLRTILQYAQLDSLFGSSLRAKADEPPSIDELYTRAVRRYTLPDAAAALRSPRIDQRLL